MDFKELAFTKAFCGGGAGIKHKRYVLEFAPSDLSYIESNNTISITENKGTEILNIFSDISKLTTISINISSFINGNGELIRSPVTFDKHSADGTGVLTSVFYLDDDGESCITGCFGMSKYGVWITPNSFVPAFTQLGFSSVIDVLYI
jgi:hypothetical protein